MAYINQKIAILQSHYKYKELEFQHSFLVKADYQNHLNPVRSFLLLTGFGFLKPEVRSEGVFAEASSARNLLCAINQPAAR